MTGLPTVEFAALLRKQFAAQCAPTDVFLELCHSGGIDPEKLSHVRDQLPEVWIAEANRLGLANIVTKTRDEPDCSAVRTINGKLIRAISSSNPSVAAFLDQLEIVTGSVPLDPASAAWIVRHFCETKGWKPADVATMEVADMAALIRWPDRVCEDQEIAPVPRGELSPPAAPVAKRLRKPKGSKYAHALSWVDSYIAENWAATDAEALEKYKNRHRSRGKGLTTSGLQQARADTKRGRNVAARGQALS